MRTGVFNVGCVPRPSKAASDTASGAVRSTARTVLRARETPVTTDGAVAYRLEMVAPLHVVEVVGGGVMLGKREIEIQRVTRTGRCVRNLPPVGHPVISLSLLDTLSISPNCSTSERPKTPLMEYIDPHSPDRQMASSRLSLPAGVVPGEDEVVVTPNQPRRLGCAFTPESTEEHSLSPKSPHSVRQFPHDELTSTQHTHIKPRVNQGTDATELKMEIACLKAKLSLREEDNAQLVVAFSQELKKVSDKYKKDVADLEHAHTASLKKLKKQLCRAQDDLRLQAGNHSSDVWYLNRHLNHEQKKNANLKAEVDRLSSLLRGRDQRDLYNQTTDDRGQYMRHESRTRLPGPSRRRTYEDAPNHYESRHYGAVRSYETNMYPQDDDKHVGSDCYRPIGYRPNRR